MIHNCHYIFYLLCKPNSFKYLCTLLKKNQHPMFMSDWILMSYQESCKYLKVLEIFTMFTQWKESKMQEKTQHSFICDFAFLYFLFSYFLCWLKVDIHVWAGVGHANHDQARRKSLKIQVFLKQTHGHLTISTWQKKRITFVQFKITTANVCPLLS